MHSDAHGDAQTWVACADLSGARQLTDIALRDSGWPVWSPDGSRIAFDSNRQDPDTTDDVVINDVYTMDRDGGDVRKLTDSVGLSGSPAYSPDGRLIAFEADRGDAPAMQGIYVMDAADGGHLQRVTTLPAGAGWDGAPRYSPDGTELVFNREVDESTAALFVVKLDGTGLRRITTSTLRPGDATWSPDGSSLVFEAEPDAARRGGPWIVGADGEGLRSLTGPPTTPGIWDGFSDPVWSPDGTLILTMHGIHHDDGSATAGLATIRPDGTGLAYVGDGTGEEHQADWASTPCR
jgi:TolB protein